MTRGPDEGANPPSAWRIRRVAAPLRRRFSAATSMVVHQPGRAALRTLGFVSRWALRVLLPVAGVAVMLHLFPYRATAAGVRFRVEGTIVTRAWLSADTTFGSWQFPNVDGLPIGVHISPENVDVVKLAAAATQNGPAYVHTLRGDIQQQLPAILWWLGGEALIGVLLGLGASAAVNLALRHLRGRTRRPRELRHRARQFGAAMAVLAAVVGYGAASYNPNWVSESRVTGTLAALQLLPGQLTQYYQHRTKFFDVISAIAGIQAQLQQHIDQRDNPSTALQIMFISDMHLAGTYPLVAQYASSFDVSLIVNTGDESEFGTKAEMTSTYRNQIKTLTDKVPMIWLAGNHDSPATVAVMRSIPGVRVLGKKAARPDGGFAVTGQRIDAYGLTVAAVPDPRVYGGEGAYGSNTPSVVDRLEGDAMDQAVAGVPDSARFDIFATHEPVAAQELVHDLPGQIRQTNSGHLHQQNKDSDVQSGDGPINLVEGSTGAGGLDNINRGVAPPPVEFSIESVSPDCQFTKVVRFQLVGPPPSGGNAAPPSGQRVSASTIYLKPQQIDNSKDRTCGTSLGISTPRDLRAP